MQPLVLAIEPDLRQAAIVKRIVREKVLADVAVVDSRDAALEAMRTTVPDVLLLSTLLSPRDEDELIAHLRTLEHAEHLQTHTIPQLASSIESGEAKPAKGLLSAFRRRKGPRSVPSGCDPDLFADEIRVYLQRASEKKRELLVAAAMPAIARTTNAAPPVVPAPPDDETATAGASSSWSSPFEWRPSGSTSRASTPEPAAAPQQAAGAAPDFTAPPLETFADHAPAAADAATEAARAAVAKDVVVAEPALAIVAREPAPVELAPAILDVASAGRREPAVVAAEPALAAPAAMTRRLPPGPLVVRRATEWWYVETRSYADARVDVAQPEDVLAALAVPSGVAAIGYADGCRIRRVRLTAAA